VMMWSSGLEGQLKVCSRYPSWYCEKRRRCESVSQCLCQRLNKCVCVCVCVCECEMENGSESEWLCGLVSENA
jgi:hypothetical protein